MSDSKWMRLGAMTVTVAGALTALYLFFDVLLGILLPFLLALLLAAVTHPVAKRFAARTKLPPKAVAAVFTLCALALFGTLVYLLFSRALYELQNFIAHLTEENSPLQAKIIQLFELVESFLARLPRELSGVFSFLGDPRELLSAQLTRLVNSLSEGLPALVMRIASALPAVLLFLLVTLIACFYFSVEYETVLTGLRNLLPVKWQARLPQVFAKVRGVLGQYLRAYFLLFLLTFVELCLGFLLLRVEYVFLLAFLVAVLDILPIFGVGVVLLPWALFALLTGNTFLGIGLVILYAVITVIRQVSEPHLVGKSLGVHPTLMLVALYAGLKLFGIVGVFAGPAVALAAKAFFTRGE